VDSNQPAALAFSVVTTPQDPENRPPDSEQKPQQAPPPPEFVPAPPPPSEPQPTGTAFPAQPNAGQPLAGQPLAGQPFAGQPPLAGQPFDGRPQTAEPKEVRLSFWLWISGAALLVLTSLLLFAQRDDLIDAARDAATNQGLTEEQLRTGATVLIAFSIVVSVVLAALMVLFAVKARAGRGWARTALTVSAVAVFLYLMVFGSSLIGLVVVVLVIGAAVVTLYLPASKAYFDAVKRAG
jgi:hypothetical protein